jgi:hypothetical protein
MALTQRYNPVSDQWDLVGTLASDEAFILVDGTINPSSTQVVEDVPLDFGNSKLDFQASGSNPVSFTPIQEVGALTTTDAIIGGIKHEFGITSNGVYRVATVPAGAGSTTGTPSLHIGYPTSSSNPVVVLSIDDFGSNNAFVELYDQDSYFGVSNSDYVQVDGSGILLLTGGNVDFSPTTSVDVGGVARYKADPTLDGLWGTFGGREIPDISYTDAAAGITSTVQTTGATQTDIDTLAVASDTTVIFTAYVVGTETATGDTLAMEVKGAIKNDGGTTSVVDSVVTDRIAEDAGASAWSVTVEADDAADQLEIKVTGEASHTIEWASKLYYNTVSF